jgi:hypothetical protein
MDRLHNQLPELVFSISGHGLETITQFFLVKSVTGTSKTEDKEEAAALEDRLVRLNSHCTLDLSLKGSVLCISFIHVVY